MPAWPMQPFEFTSEKAMGEEGYLSDRGLIPSPAAQRESVRAQARNLESLRLADLRGGD